MEVVGVMEDGKYESPVESQQLAVFLPEAAAIQHNHHDDCALFVAGRGIDQEDAPDNGDILILICRSSALAG